MSTVLFATDGSKPSLIAEDYLSDIYDPNEDDLLIVSVANIPPHLFEYIDFGSDVEDIYETAVGEEFVQQAREKALDAKERLVAEGYDVEIEIRTGTPGPQICNVAGEREVDCIVTGKRGQSSQYERLLGSVSQHVLHNSNCPVYVVPMNESQQAEYK